jgi:hypothetical protein
MAFVYRGNLPELKQEVAEVTDVVNATYKRILGNQRYAKLELVSQRILTPEAFYDDVDDVERDIGHQVQDSNKMLILSPSELKFRSNGELKNKKIRTSVAFYISEEGFKKTGSAKFTNRPVASYIHEFDHFVSYALQRTPLYIANLILQESLEPEKKSDLTGYINAMMEAGISPSQIKENMVTLQVLKTYTDIHEKANRILDKMVLAEIGITVPLHWRHQEKSYGILPTPTGAMMFPTGGDPFRGSSDQEAFESYLDWENRARFTASMPKIQRVIDSVRNIRISRVPLVELLRE